MDEFEWHEAKNAANQKRHGIDFEDAIEIFDGPTVEKIDDRYDYGEERVIAFGMLRQHVIVVVFTWRGDVCRIISARKAEPHERRAYHQALASRTPNG